MNRLLEEYVAEVSYGLRALPEARREEEIQELRAHLDALIADEQTNGHSETVATQAALYRFGDARQVRRGIMRVWWRQRWQTATATERFLRAFLTALVAQLLLFCSPVPGMLYYLLTFGTNPQGERSVILSGVLLLLVTAWAGYFAARLGRKEALAGVATAHLLWMLALVFGGAAGGSEVLLYNGLQMFWRQWQTDFFPAALVMTLSAALPLYRKYCTRLCGISRAT